MNEIETQGFVILTGVIDPSTREELLDELGAVSGAGRRGLLSSPMVARFAGSDPLMRVVRPHFVTEPRPVRGIFFDKSLESNWLVPWHQDLTVALQDRVDHEGFGPWSEKDGIIHARAPTELLEKMLTVRIHLDDTDAINGALRVLPGTHRLGRLSGQQIQSLRSRISDHFCSAAAGDALLMRPLLLHASGRSASGGHRRILHLEYAGFELPQGLEWHEAA